MANSIAGRVRNALQSTRSTPEMRKAYLDQLLTSATRHAEAYERRLRGMALIAIVWTMISLGAVELKEVSGLRVLNLSVVDLVGPPLVAFFYYQSMLSFCLLDLLELARRTYYSEFWPELSDGSLDELLVSPETLSDDNSVSNLEINSKVLRGIFDFWTGLLGIAFTLGPLWFLYWASQQLLLRMPLGSTATYVAVAVTSMFGVRGALVFLQRARA